MTRSYRVFDLQFFGGEKTEPATPKRRNDAREKGQMAKSKDLGAAVEIMVGLCCVYLLAGIMRKYIVLMFEDTLHHVSSDLMFDPGWWIRPVAVSVKTFFISWGPIGLLGAIVAIAINLYQVGFKFITKPFIPDFNRFNPVSGLKKIISMKGLVELLKGLFKAGILLYVLYTVLRDDRDMLLSSSQFPLEQGTELIFRKMWNVAMKMALVLLIIALIDYKYQKYEFDKSIKMSKQEIKDEHKNAEGDPKIKSKIRQKQREMAMKRMMADVPKADVVVTNPTELAIAIQYDQKVMSAPVVLAKGQDRIAARIREIAKEHKIPIVENRPLAHALMRQVEVGESIPADLYRSVAEVLAFVYKLKQRQQKRRW